MVSALQGGITVYGVTAHGGHAEYLKVPVRTLVPLPDELSFVAGAAVSCGTGTAYGALRRMHIAGGSTLAVFGQGPVGVSATLLGAKMGARVIAIEKNAERRELAKKFGAAYALESDERIKEITKGEGVDLAMDTTGVRRRAWRPFAARRPGARCASSAKAATSSIDVSRDMLRKQLTIIGSWTFSAMGQLECARFAVDNGVDVDALFSHRWKLEQVDEAYRLFDTQSTGKGVIVF